jgi:lipopolysaccharide/colanic/teichoic acid biosynthesis glycosyltransferase
MLTNLDLFQPVEMPTEETPLKIRKHRKSSKPAPLWIPRPLTGFQRCYLPIRRVLDFALTLVITVVATPIILLAALVVKLSSRGPAFYTQQRIGRDGKIFTIYKLRTMIHNCESLTGPRWTMPGDPRVTPIGWFLRQTHFDELPQLLNVLRGDMSLIGPRPERPEFVTELERSLPGYGLRHRLLPGITGLAQVQLPPDTDLESVRRKLMCDLHFVENCTPWLDVRILAATVLHLLGMSFARLLRLRVVPRPVQAEMPMALPLPETQAVVHQQAA